MLVNGFKGIHAIAKPLGHFVSVLIQHQAIGDDVLKSYSCRRAWWQWHAG